MERTNRRSTSSRCLLSIRWFMTSAVWGPSSQSGGRPIWMSSLYSWVTIISLYFTVCDIRDDVRCPFTDVFSLFRRLELSDVVVRFLCCQRTGIICQNGEWRHTTITHAGQLFGTVFMMMMLRLFWRPVLIENLSSGLSWTSADRRGTVTSESGGNRIAQ